MAAPRGAGLTWMFRQWSSPSYRRVPSLHTNGRCSTRCKPWPIAPAGRHLRLLGSDQAIYVVGFSLGGPVSSSSWTISSWNLPYARRKSTLGVAKNPLPGYSKRHSITTTYHASRRHAAYAAQSRNPSCEVAGATPPLPGRQGVRGSNPRCSTQI